MDPPYASWAYITQTQEGKNLNVDADARWSGAMFEWVGQWMWPMAQALTPGAVGWVFCNVHYIGFYLRWTHYMRWPFRGLFSCGGHEYLLAFGDEPLSSDAATAVADACRLNTYGQNKPVEMLRVLLRYSPPGAVLDPFMGQGSTLLAALAEQREAIGVEVRPEFVAEAVRKLEAICSSPMTS